MSKLSFKCPENVPILLKTYQYENRLNFYRLFMTATLKCSKGGNMKQCVKCKKIKTKSDFYGNVKTSDKLQSACKECHSEYRKVTTTVTYHDPKPEYSPTFERLKPIKPGTKMFTYLQEYEMGYDTINIAARHGVTENTVKCMLRLAGYQNRRQVPLSVACICCGTRFKPKLNGKKFCGKSCANKFNAALRAGRIDYSNLQKEQK